MINSIARKKYTLISAVFIAVFVFLGIFSSIDRVGAQATSGNAHGYIQAPNIGWISSNCVDLGVCASSPFWIDIAPSTSSQTASFSGYGWSPNIGWIGFNPADVAYCGSQAVVDLTTGVTTGFARALAGGTAGSGGWDGCISMKGSNYGVVFNTSTQAFGGYAWGDPVVGWIDFTGLTADLSSSQNPNNPPNGSNTPGFNLLVNNAKTAAISSGDSVQLTWQTKGISSCTTSGDWPQNVTFTGKDVADGNHTFVVPNITSAKTYTMNCTLVTPSSAPLPSQSVTVTIRPQSCEVIPNEYVIKAGSSPISTTVKFGAQWISTNGYPNVTIGAGSVLPSGFGTTVGSITGNPVSSATKYSTIAVSSSSPVTATQKISISGTTAVTGAQSCTPATLYIVPPNKCQALDANNIGGDLPCTYDVNTKPSTKRPPWEEI